MTATGHDIQSMLKRLEALLSSGVLTQAEAVSCSGLAEALRRPARVAIFGQSADDVTGVLRSMLGEGLVNVLPDGPAIQLSHGEAAQHLATFEDGSSLSQEGLPTDNLMRQRPLFLQIEAPLPTLATMSFLALELGEDAESYTPALRWAAKRSEIAILCAEGFGEGEAALWAAAPDRLKNHCYLVTTGNRDPASTRARGLFDAVVHEPSPSEASPPLSVLKKRLATDISEARQEDVAAAALFLFRFYQSDLSAPENAFDDASPVSAPMAEAPGSHGDDHTLEEMDPPAGAAARSPGFFEEVVGATVSPDEGVEEEIEAYEPEPLQEPAVDDVFDTEPQLVSRDITRKLVSAPILHLKRRSRALAEILEWREEDEDWFEEVLTHCAETAEALRDLSVSWPDGDPIADQLRDAIDQACDTVVLLQVEAGPDQAEDAARVLYQLRTDFEQAMAA